MANALVWQDTRVDDYVAELSREGGADRFRAKTGLPLSTYFSSLKIRWLLEHVPGVPQESGSRRSNFRQHRFLSHLAPYRRP